MLNIISIREVQIKTTVIPLHTHQDGVKQSKKENQKITSVGKNMQKLKPLCISGGNVKILQLLWKTT